MYEEFYGLKAKPFHITPDTDYLFLSHNHQKAIACMEFGVLEDTGIILLTGDIGTGKTTLIRHMLTKFDKDIRVATIYNTNVNALQLLAMIMEEFGMASPASEKKAHILKFIEAGLLEMCQQGFKPLIIIDDAQNLSFRTLEEVRLLSNFQSNDRMLVQIIMVGQPELKEKLDDPLLAALVQRIGISYHIMPFNKQETESYIDHRLKIAGGDISIFDASALELIFEIAQGNPRTINLLCDHGLVYGFADEIKVINENIISQVLEDNPTITKYVEKEPTPSAEKPAQKPAETEAKSTSEALQVQHTPFKKKRTGNWQQRIEYRLQTLEQLMSEYNRELRDVIKSIFEQERQKNDNLIQKYARLESEANILKQRLAENDHREPPSAPSKKSGSHG